MFQCCFMRNQTKCYPPIIFKIISTCHREHAAHSGNTRAFLKYTKQSWQFPVVRREAFAYFYLLPRGVKGALEMARPNLGEIHPRRKKKQSRNPLGHKRRITNKTNFKVQRQAKVLQLIWGGVLKVVGQQGIISKVIFCRESESCHIINPSRQSFEIFENK